MFKVLKNLKNSVLSVIAIVILLCVQAWADLELPSYTSKIVNVGIQQGGIEDVTPVVISKNEMENLLIFTNEDEKILSYYELNTNDMSSQASKKIEKYFDKENKVEPNTVYALKDLKQEEQNELNEIIEKPLMEAYSVTNETISEQIKGQILQQLPE